MKILIILILMGVIIMDHHLLDRYAESTKISITAIEVRDSMIFGLRGKVKQCKNELIVKEHIYAE